MEQPRETQQLREQLARASVKEGLALPPLSLLNKLNKETSGCLTLWGCSMVCIGKNIAHCSKNPQFVPVMCVLCPRCAHTPPKHEVGVEPLFCLVFWDRGHACVTGGGLAQGLGIRLRVRGGGGYIVPDTTMPPWEVAFAHSTQIRHCNGAIKCA